MNPIILGLGVEIAIQAVFLTVALLIMIKIQNLDYHFLGLVGSATLACALDSILTYFLEPWFQDFAGHISAIVFVVVLAACISKVTRAEAVDVVFTVVVGGALRFIMNLWLIGMLMGDLRPSVIQARNESLKNIDGGHPTAVETNRPAVLVQTTNKASWMTKWKTIFSGKPATVETNRPAVLVQTTNKVSWMTSWMTKLKMIFGGKSPAKSASTNPVKSATNTVSQGKVALTPAPVNNKGPVPAALVNDTVKLFSLKGIINSGKPSAMIYSGIKTYTVFQGDSLSMETLNGKAVVHCDQVDKDKVVLNIAGQQVTFSIPVAAP